MTFGIDISTHNAGLDLAAAKAAGAEFVIVKSVASYKPELTIADDYHEGIDRALAAGLGHAKGHYAVPNSRNTPEETAKFQWGIRYKPADSDIYMLDNEPLDTYKVFWRDDLAAQYFYTLRDLGARYDQMWLYCPAALTRASGPWPKIEALRKLGLRIVWVSYGDNDPFREDGEEPLLGGGITGWDVHQFTSSWTVPGYAGKVDGNYSPHSIDDLFGGGIVPLNNYMLRSPSTVILADDRDPYVSWQSHLARTSGLRGGVDLVAAVGTPVYARTAGRMLQIPNDGTAGNSSRYAHRDNPGWQDVFSHLSSYKTPKNPTGLNAFDYEAGDIVAYTGNSGNVDAHLHWHLLDPSGVRRNPWDYFSGSATAGDGTTPIKPEEKNTMAEAYIRVPNDAVVHFLPGVKTTFSNLQEFANWRAEIGGAIALGSADAVNPPAVPFGVTWNGFLSYCKHFGVDPARDSDGTKSLTAKDLEAIAAAVAGKTT